VDEQPVSGPRVRAWQRTIAHVPQSIYLSDSSLAENIAFGVSRDKIDLERMRNAARQAQIAEFIEGRPEGYDASSASVGLGSPAASGSASASLERCNKTGQRPHSR